MLYIRWSNDAMEPGKFFNCWSTLTTASCIWKLYLVCDVCSVNRDTIFFSLHRDTIDPRNYRHGCNWHLRTTRRAFGRLIRSWGNYMKTGRSMRTFLKPVGGNHNVRFKTILSKNQHCNELGSFFPPNSIYHTIWNKRCTPVNTVPVMGVRIIIYT